MHSLGLVAVAPFWSQSDNLNTDSNYTFLRVVLPEMQRQCPNTLFLMLFPDPSYGNDVWRYTPDGLQSSMIRFIKWPYDTAALSSVVGFPVSRFREIDMGMGVTLWWLNQLEMGSMVIHGYQKVYVKFSQPAVVGHNHYVIHRTLPYIWETQFSRLWLQMGGALACDRTVYHSAYALDMARETYSDFLNEKTIRMMESKSRSIWGGFVRPDDPIAPLAGPDDPPIVIYNHRFEAYKNPNETFDVLDRMRSLHPSLRVWATQLIGQSTRDKRIDHIAYASDRTEYLDKIAVPAINTLNSLHETLCASIIDSMALGHIVVLPNRLTFPEIVPKGYPFLFSTVNEQAAMLDKIIATWPEEYNRWHDILAQHARANFAVGPYVTKYLSVMWEAESEHRVIERKDTTVKSLHDAWLTMKLGKPYPIKELATQIRNISGLAVQAMPARRVVREAMVRGDIEIAWRDGVCLTRMG